MVRDHFYTQALQAGVVVHLNTPAVRTLLSSLYGPNTLVVPKPRLPWLVMRQVMHPLFLFQAFSVIIW